MIINYQAVLALILSIAGLASHPEVLNLLPESWAAGLTLLGIVAQAVTQQVARQPITRDSDASSETKGS